MLWARMTEHQAHPYIIALVEALTRKRNWAYWASLNHFELMPRNYVAVESWRSRLIVYLLHIRNVLVFFPVALTWAAVGKSTSAFEVFIKTHPGAVVNFLDFWQRGYGSLAREWRISDVALVDFLIVSTIILLTFYTSIEEQKLEAANEKLFEEYDETRIRLALHISEFFFDKQKLTPPVVDRTIKSSVQNLLNASKSLEVTTYQLSQQTRGN